MMRSVVSLAVVVTLLPGCALWRKDIISPELPLTMQDIEEIRTGDEAHKLLFQPKNSIESPQYKLYVDPKLQAYITSLGNGLAHYSPRPNLPYQFFIIDSDEVNVFGLGGGRVYITREFIHFIETEDQLAGGIAHEIGHIAARHYMPGRDHTKLKTAYEVLVRVTGETQDLAGIYGKAAHQSLKAVGSASPYIKKSFQPNQESQADRIAIECMVKAGFNPIGLFEILTKVSTIEITQVNFFVNYLRVHGDSPKRRRRIERKIRQVNKEAAVIPAVHGLVEPSLTFSDIKPSLDKIPDLSHGT